MPEDRGTIREIDWFEVFPWLALVRVLPIATRAPMIALGTLGLVATIFGWWLIGWVFSGRDDARLQSWIASYQSCPWRATADAPSIPVTAPPSMPVAAPPALPGANVLPLPGPPLQPMPTPPVVAPVGPRWPHVGFPHTDAPPALGPGPSDAVIGPWQQLSAPAWQLFDRRLDFVGLAFILLCLLWAVAVWSVCGGALTRMAAMKLGREESISLTSAVRFARERWRSYVAAPLFPLVGVLICTLPMMLMGVLMRADFGLFLAGILWPLMLVGGVLMAVFVLAPALGWPLMFATISTEGGDSFEALSRSYNYVYGRPLHLLFYVFVATLVGSIAWLLAWYAGEAVVYLTQWAASWGAGERRMVEIVGGPGAGPLSTMGRRGAGLIWFFSGCVRLVAQGFAYSFFWTAVTAIYFLLRRDEDGAELDEVFVGDTSGPYGLPPLEPDAAGVPHLADEPAGDEPEGTLPGDQPQVEV